MSQPYADRPLLVFGGPYSNLQALQAIKAVADDLALPPSNVVCTGDVVAYCGAPAEAVDFARDWDCHIVAGNCEEQLAAGGDDCGCGFEAGTSCDLLSRNWYAFAQSRIDAGARRWMAGLPSRLTLDFAGARLDVVHGGIDRNNQFIFPSDAAAIAEELVLSDASIVVAGHCGIPFIAREKQQVWFNPGVIGMPANDGTCDGWYGLITPAGAGRLALSTHRLSYDFAKAARDTRAGGHADAYAAALETGLWPSLDVLPARERQATGMAIAPARTTVEIANPRHAARVKGDAVAFS